MDGENITVNLDCRPWVLEDASADDLNKLTERIAELARELILDG